MADMENVPHEVERKFVVRMPEEGWFEAQPGHVAKDIKQTYIDMGQEGELRVRQTTIGDDVSFVSTEKRGEGIDRVEIEKDLTEAEAAEMLEYAITWQTPIEKTRHVVPFGGHDFEIDVYPWDDKNCIMEVELGSADEEFDLPEGITVVGEVTYDPEFKNGSLAKLDKDGPAGGLVGLYSATHIDFLPETLDDMKSAVQAKKARIHRGVFVDDPEAVNVIKEHLGAPVPQKDGWRYGTVTMPMRDRSDGLPFGPDTLEPFHGHSSHLKQALNLDEDKVKAIREKLDLPERPAETDGKSMIDVDLPTDAGQASDDLSK